MGDQQRFGFAHGALGPPEWRFLIGQCLPVPEFGILTGSIGSIGTVTCPMNHRSIIHDLVVEWVGSSERFMLQNSRVGEHSIERHLSMGKGEGGGRII